MSAYIFCAYKNIRSEIRTGDLLLFRDSLHPMSVAIRYITKSQYSHVGMALRIYGRLYIIEALRQGVVIHRLSWRLANLNGEIDVYRLNNDISHDTNLIATEAMSYVDYKYDWRTLIRIWANKWFGAKIINTPNAVICSEFIDRVVRNTTGYQLGSITPDGTTPAMIAENSFYQFTIEYAN